MGRKAFSGILVATRYFVEWFDWVVGKCSLYLGFSIEDGINSNFGLRDG